MRHLLITLVCLATLLSNAEARPLRVLLVYSFGRDFAPYDMEAAEFRTRLAEKLSRPVEFLEVSLEMSRLGDTPREEPLVEFLRGVFSEAAPDLLVPFGAAAALFLSTNRGLFPGTPILVIGASRPEIAGIFDDPDVPAVGPELPAAALLENILTVLPATRHVHVVMGSAPLGRFWESELQAAWPQLAPDITFHWLSDVPLPEISRRLDHAPAHSVVFFGILNRDAAGTPFLSNQGLNALHQRASLPVFGFFEQQLGHGIVGGRLVPLRKAGAVAAEAAASLLRGVPASELRVPELPLNEPAYDWRELSRWNIPLSALPPGSEVRHRPPSLWESHRDTALAGAAILGLQTILILLLVTARRRAHETEATLRVAADAAGIGLWQRDLATERLTGSAKWADLCGVPAGQPVTFEQFLERVHPEDAEHLRAESAAAIETGADYDCEYRVELPGGEQRWIHSRGRVELDHGGRPVRTRGASMDVTQRKRIETELAEQHSELAHLSRVASLSVISGSLAHELNQPLGIILSNAQAAQRLLSQDQPDLREVSAILSDIVTENRRAGDVIQRLRTLLRREEGPRERLSLNTLLPEVVRLLRSDLIGRGVRIMSRLEPALPAVQGDAVQLQQVFFNMITNACEAMQETPASQRIIRLKTWGENGHVRLAVRDHGCGLPFPPDELFRPFHTTKPKGLGMGLTISRTLVGTHGGRLWAESHPEGGTTFHVELPAVPPP